jgi:hypothetical protein
MKVTINTVTNIASPPTDQDFRVTTYNTLLGTPSLPNPGSVRLANPNLPGSIVSTTQVYHDANSNGVLDMGECIGDPITVTMIVNPRPQISYTLNGQTIANVNNGIVDASENVTITVCDADLNVTSSSINANGNPDAAMKVTINTVTNIASPPTDQDFRVTTYNTLLGTPSLPNPGSVRLANPNLPGSIVSTTQVYHDANSNGVLDMGECIGDPITVTMIVNPRPQISYTLNGQTIANVNNGSVDASENVTITVCDVDLNVTSSSINANGNPDAAMKVTINTVTNIASPPTDQDFRVTTYNTLLGTPSLPNPGSVRLANPNLPGSIVSTTQVYHDANSNGVLDMGECIGDPITVTMIVNPRPQISYTLNGQTIANVNNGSVDASENVTITVCDADLNVTSSSINAGGNPDAAMKVTINAVTNIASPPTNQDFRVTTYNTLLGTPSLPNPGSVRLANPNLPGSIVSTTQVYHDANSNGVLDMGECIGDPITVTMIVNPRPQISYTLNGQTIANVNNGSVDASENVTITVCDVDLNVTSSSINANGNPDAAMKVTINTVTNIASPPTDQDFRVTTYNTLLGTPSLPNPGSVRLANPNLPGSIVSTTQVYHDANSNGVLDMGECVGDPITVTMIVNPNPDIFVSGPTSDVCPGTNIVLDVTNPNGVGGSFNWIAKDALNNPIGSGVTGAVYGTGAVNTNLGITCPVTIANPISFILTPVGLSSTFCIGNSTTFTVNVRDIQPPAITTTATSGDLGCNPTVVAPVFTGSDNCEGIITPVVTSSGPSNTGCSYTQTWNANYTDLCGNVATTSSITYTWQVVTAPVLSNVPSGGSLGCNPTTLPTCDNTVTASNACGSVSVTCTPGIITNTGCDYTQSFTYSATACGLTTTQTVTYTWQVVTAPVLANVPSGGSLGCNPMTLPSCDNTVTASNECGSVTVTCIPGSITNTGCDYTQIFTYSATACGLTTTQSVTYTWQVVTAPVLANVPSGGSLGCNPINLPICSNSVTASNECGSVTVTCIPGSITNTGCDYTQSFTYSATACGLTTTQTVTYTWQVVTAPVLANVPSGGSLGCNPMTLPSCDNTVTASNECGSVTVTCIPGSITNTGCDYTQIFTYSATACGLSTTQTVTYTWQVVTAPVLANVPSGGSLGCNPTTLPSCNNSVTASNECGSVTVTCIPGSITNTGCDYTQSFTYSATACGLTTTQTVTYTWQVVTAPVLANVPSGGSLGCNPMTLPSCDNTVTASNECGSVTVTCIPGSITNTGCDYTQIFTYSATACGLSTTQTVTYTWQVVTAPVLANVPSGGSLGCNPTTLPSCNNSVTASNECGSVTVTCTPGSITNTGCDYTQIFTYSATACGLTTTQSVTYTWQVVTAPVLANVPSGGSLGCNPINLPICSNSVTASNECGSVTVTCIPGSITNTGCDYTQSFTYSATACGLTTTQTVTYTWQVVTAPVLANVPSGGSLGCNPMTLPSCDNTVTASNECGSVTVTCIPGSITNTGCDYTQIFTYSATACGLSTTQTVTYTWQVVTAPVLANVPSGGSLGCNPTTLPSCNNSVTASNECGSVTVTCTPGSITNTGCDYTQSFTYSATACGLSTTQSVTYTWQVVTAPVLANVPSGGSLGCNPINLPICSNSVTASNECGSVTVTCTAGSITNTGCDYTQIFTYSATACGLTTTQSVTYTWQVVTAPVLANVPSGGSLGCNPINLPICSNSVTASNECGSVTVTCAPGSITNTGCDYTQIFTYSATACGLSTTQSVTYTWQVVTAPVLANVPIGGSLGCNPMTLPSCNNSVTASNECGSVTVTCTASSITNTGCDYTQIFTYSATACGLTTTQSVTYTWQVLTAPVLANVPSGGSLGCNPINLPICSNSVTASNACGPVTVNCTPGSITNTGCDYTQIFTYSATACGLSTTQTVTYTWIQDNLAPVISNTIAPSTVVGCHVNTAAPAVNTVAALEALGLTITDCVQDQDLIVTNTDQISGTCPIVILRTYTITDLCGNSSNYTQTINVQPPLGVSVKAKALLQGAYVLSDGLMHDSLRMRQVIPNLTPYSGGADPVIAEAGGQIVSDAVLGYNAIPPANPGNNNSIVDWVYLELRSGSNPAIIVANMRALIQRDGDIVSHLDGSSDVYFATVCPGSYYVSIKHRNHLGIMSAAALPFPGCGSPATVFDFTTPDTTQIFRNPFIGNSSRKNLGNGFHALWCGDANHNKAVRYNGTLNDKDAILSAVGISNPNNILHDAYRPEDVNMDSRVRYNGFENDRSFLLSIINPNLNLTLYQHTPN